VHLFVVVSTVALPIAAFATNIIPLSGTKTIVIDCLHRVFVSIAPMPDLVSTEYHIQPFQTSVVPSLSFWGLRVSAVVAVLFAVEWLIVSLQISLGIISDCDVRIRTFAMPERQSSLHFHLLKFMRQRF
jgi:hypothetical protein